ncbi:MAG: XdhC family protein [Solirubrobacteraceae bacterium]|jgi:xanthine dehydrogenase accessory factor
MIRGELAERVASMTAQRQSFVLATVVRARRPTSVRPGDVAVVTGDGTIEGFVGGVCAESSVRLHALRTMETGEPLLLRLIPGDDGAADPGAVGPGDQLEGAVVEHNPCLSGGALEIFLEPHLPAPRLLVLGGSPIARALHTLAAAGGYDCLRTDAGEDVDITGAAAVVVASHGSAEEGTLVDALAAGVPYVALVASPRRGAAVRAGLDIPDELRAQLHTPAGLDIGARTPIEIAVSILAELVAVRHADPVREPAAAARREAEVVAPAAVTVAVDPVCGMRVAVVASTPRLEVDGERVFFCGDGCRRHYATQHTGAR